jgi:hypothetical protein
MKKLLLSLGLLSATLFVNAQQLTLWNGQGGFSGVQGTPKPFNNGSPLNPAVLPTANPAVDAGLYVDTMGVGKTAVGTGTYPYAIQATGSCDASSGYYIGGFGLQTYNTAGTVMTFGGNGASFCSDMNKAGFSNYAVYFTGQYTGTAPQVQVQLVSNVLSDTTYAAVVNLDVNSYAAGTWNTYSLPLSSFNSVNASNYSLTGPALIQSVADSIFKFAFSITPGAGDGSGAVKTGTATFQLGNIWIGSSGTFLGTQSAAANITQSALFPNPSNGSGYVNVNLTLANPSDVSFIVSDLTGRQIATTPTQSQVTTLTNSQVFNTAGLTKGMYTVTYVLNGTPAKTELVAVQ